MALKAILACRDSRLKLSGLRLLTVRVLAARFTDADAGQRALAQLRGSLDLGEQDVGLAPLGGADDLDTGAVLLAGRFRDTALPAIRSLIEQCGGVIVADVDETRVRSRSAGAGVRSTTCH